MYVWLSAVLVDPNGVLLNNQCKQIIWSRQLVQNGPFTILSIIQLLTSESFECHFDCPQCSKLVWS